MGIQGILANIKLFPVLPFLSTAAIKEIDETPHVRSTVCTHATLFDYSAFPSFPSFFSLLSFS